MEYYVNHIQSKEIDTRSIQELGIPSLILMERASLSVAELVMEYFKPEDGTVLAVCAAGNNGADGMAAARILTLKGYHAEILLSGNPEKATSEWHTQFHILQNLHIPYRFCSQCNQEEIETYIKSDKNAVLIDALFGIGLKREVKGQYAELIRFMNEAPAPVVAVDIPSGINSDNGKIEGTAVKAWATVTFGRKKVGQILYPGTANCGMLRACEIGFAPEAVEKAGFDAFGYTPEDIQALMKKRPENSHKGTFGKILVIAGCKTMAGAAVFSARAAYRMGTGLVKIHTVKENQTCIHQMLPEAILSVYDSQQYNIFQLKDDCNWADVIVFGPGMGREAHVAQILEYLLNETVCPLILDADGLRVLAEHKEWYSKLNERVIITPHMGEMAGLCGEDISAIKENPVYAARKFADEWNCICVMKGARTVVVQKSMPYYINQSGCSAMATAGSGDVLTGIIADLAAEGHSNMRAAALGVYIHGLAGEAAGKEKGNRGAIASDILEGICQVCKDC